MWYAVNYPTELLNKELPISQLEMFNVLIAINLLKEQLQGHVIRIYCDNSATVSVIETGKSRCPILLECARKIWTITARYGIEVLVRHIAGVMNGNADML